MSLPRFDDFNSTVGLRTDSRCRTYFNSPDSMESSNDSFDVKVGVDLSDVN